jgi:hypothetical protein
MFSSELKQSFKKVRSYIKKRHYITIVLLALSLITIKQCDLLDFTEPDYREDHIPGEDLPVTPQSLTINSTGLTNGDVVLVNNENSESLTVTGVGNFTFPTQVDAGSPYDIEISQNNTFPQQNCLLTNGSGIMPFSETTNIALNCDENTYQVSGTISGLAPALSSDLILQLNGANDLTIPAGSTAFTFSPGASENSIYNVTVKNHPLGPSQNCIIVEGSGFVPVYNTPYVPSSGLLNGTGYAVDNSLSCTTNTFSVGFNVVNIAGSGLKVSIESPAGNSLETQDINLSGNFVFDTLVTDGSNYQLVVTSNPSVLNQTCLFNISTGTLIGGNIPSSAHTLNCTTQSYGVTANVTGLGGGE